MKKWTIVLVLAVLGVPAIGRLLPLLHKQSNNDQTEMLSAIKPQAASRITPSQQSSATPSTTFKLDVPIRIRGVAESTNPVWSPINPLELAFVGSDGTYVAQVSTRSLRKISADRVGFKFAWTKDGKHLIFRTWMDEQLMAIRSVNALTGEARTLGQSTDLSLPQEVSAGIIAFRDSGLHRVVDVSEVRVPSSLPQPFVYQLNDNIFVRTAGGTKQITTDDGKYFLPQLSPDGKKVLYQELSRGFYVTDLTSHTTTHLGTGDDATWSPDSDYIVFEVTTDSNDKVVGSELFVSDLAGKRVQLTFTDNVIEMRPSWSCDGKRLAFESGGHIYVATLIAREAK